MGTHYYITRYGLKNNDPNWFDTRLEIFKKYTLPSLLAQTNIEWANVLLVDNLMPKRCLDEFSELLSDDERFIITDKFEYGDDIYTRLDSDDIVAADFTQKVYDLIEPGKLLNFNKGYYLRVEQGESRDDKLYHQHNYPYNMFLTVWDKRGPYHDQHTRMGKHFEAIEDKTDSMWVHLYHPETYTAYRKRGKRLPQEALVSEVDYKRFPSLYQKTPN